VVLDVGFGFGKTIAHNYELLRSLPDFQLLGAPLLVGVSRKSMVYKPLQTDPEGALLGSTALHAWALERGAHLLRVHDVEAAVQVITLFDLLRNPETDLN
jgi:dihydropteroate synthase